MKYYLITSTFFDFKMFSERFHDDRGPRHTMFEIAQRLDAEICQPETGKANAVDWAMSKLVGLPSHWALARTVLKKLKEGDVIYCAGEDTGTAIAILIKLFGVKVNLAIYFLNPENRRVKYLFKIFNLKSVVKLFTVTDKHKQQNLINQYGVCEQEACVLPEQVDELFFKPGPGAIGTGKFLIACAGMEQRDYLTLAQAIEGLDVELKFVVTLQISPIGQIFSFLTPFRAIWRYGFSSSMNSGNCIEVQMSWRSACLKILIQLVLPCLWKLSHAKDL